LGTKALMAFDRQVTLFEGWVSPVFGAKMPAPVAQVTQRGVLPMLFGCALDLSGRFRSLRIQLRPDGCGVDCIYDDVEKGSLVWSRGK